MSITDYTMSMFLRPQVIVKTDYVIPIKISLTCQQYLWNKKRVHILLTNFDKIPLMLNNLPALHTWPTILYMSTQAAHAGPSRQPPECHITLPDFRIFLCSVQDILLKIRCLDDSLCTPLDSNMLQCYNLTE